MHLSGQKRDLALRATTALGLVVCGVDLLRTGSGPLLTELNPNPALVALAGLCGPQVYTQVADAVCFA